MLFSLMVEKIINAFLAPIKLVIPTDNLWELLEVESLSILPSLKGSSPAPRELFGAN